MAWPNGGGGNQVDYVIVRKRFRSNVLYIDIRSARCFPASYVGSDHGLLTMIFRLRLKWIIKQTNTRIKYDLDKLEYSTWTEVVLANIGGKFTPLK